MQMKKDCSEEEKAIFRIPTLAQIKNYKDNHILRNKVSFDYGKLYEALLEKSKEVEGDDEPFVIKFQVCADLEDRNRVSNQHPQIGLNQFRFCISTKRLLRIAAKYCRVIHVDSTYKLMWLGNPVLILGTSDSVNKFHPFCLAVTTNEKDVDFQFLFHSLQKGIESIGNNLHNLNFNVYNIFNDNAMFTGETPLSNVDLMADAAPAITNGFEAVFGFEQKRGMCYFHVKQAIEKKLLALNDIKLQIDILTDLSDIQRCQSKLLFDNAMTLFKKKYEKSDNSHINSFLEYFEEYWVKRNPGWVSL